jgi:carboxyl-terminal processing protease
LRSEIGSKLKGYVLDLRNNRGGLLDEAILSADVFLEKGLIVELRGRAKTERRTAQPGDAAKGAPLFIMVNGATAAGAEIMAAALQDNKRARVLGARTAGNGSVQTIIPLGAMLGTTLRDGALRLTTSHHYTPLGKWLESNGIEPDVVVERAAAGDGPPSLVPANQSRDAQLQRALSLLRDGR